MQICLIYLFIDNSLPTFALMLETITILRSEYEKMQQELAELRKLVALVEELRTEIALLKGGKNSKTSSTSPSQDLGRSNKISLRVSSGKKSGGQLGHKGTPHSFSQTPNEIIDHYPCVCAHCGESLQEVDSSSFTRRQKIDIPPVEPIYIEHRSHVKKCPLCGFGNQGIFPDNIQAPIQYGSLIEVMIDYLSVYQTLPYKRITDLFKDFFGLHLSEGSVDNFLNRLSEKSKPAYEVIRKKIEQSQIVGSDETGCRVHGKKHWFHVWQTPALTFIVAFLSRGYAAIS